MHGKKHTLRAFFSPLLCLALLIASGIVASAAAIDALATFWISSSVAVFKSVSSSSLSLTLLADSGDYIIDKEKLLAYNFLA